MDILAQAFVLGAIGGVVPGAVLTILLVSAMQGGMRTGLRAFWWVMLSEVLIAGGLLLVAAQFPLSPAVFTAIGLVGGFVLFYFAWQVFKLRAVTIQNDTVLFTGPKILVLTATNAPLYIFWVTICFPLIWQLAAVWGLPTAATSYFLLFEIGWGLTTFIMLLLFVYARGVLTNERVMRVIFSIVASILVLFGLKMFITSAVALL